MTPGVLGCVLAFAIGIISGRPENSCPMLFGAIVVAIKVTDAHHHRVCCLDWRILAPATLSQNDSSVADVELHTMICDLYAQSESESITEPAHRLDYVWIGQLWNNSAAWDGPVL